MGSDWKDKLYEPEGELVSVRNLAYDQDEIVSQQDAEEERKELITITDVDLDYLGKKGARINALQDITFNIYNGEFICVLGPSGCGKSTLLKILAGFIRPTNGSVKLNGQEVTGTEWHRGVVFQNPPVYEWFSGRDNVAFGPKMRDFRRKSTTGWRTNIWKRWDCPNLRTRKSTSCPAV